MARGAFVAELIVSRALVGHERTRARRAVAALAGSDLTDVGREPLSDTDPFVSG
jgi:hypothetical protein